MCFGQSKQQPKTNPKGVQKPRMAEGDAFAIHHQQQTTETYEKNNH
jgi:hypothetical protein